MTNPFRISRVVPVATPLALLLVCSLAYLPMIHRLGFYWDDWPSIWFLHFWGGQGFREGFASDRPLLAWVFMLTTPIFGETPVSWQYFSIFTRWITSLAWWWSLRGIWTGQPRLVFWAAALFAVFPGFSQQYIAVTYSNAYLVYFLFILSIGTMIWAHRQPRWFYPLAGISLLFSLFSLLITEYFYSLELLRPFILWVLIDPAGESWKSRANQVMRRWAPYLALLIPALFWKALINPSPRAEITLFNELLQNPVTTAIALGRTILGDFFEVNFLAWLTPANLAFLKDFEASVLRLLAGAVIASLLVTLVFSLFLRRKQAFTPGSEKYATPLNAARQAIELGILAFLVSGWTIWITNLHFELFFPYDRFLLITMLGTSLLIAGLAALIEKRIPLGSILIALLVGVSVGIQFQYRLQYRQEWLSQKNFFWQLVWRAPGILPGTTVMTSEIPFQYFSDNSLTAPLNWIYAPANTSREMDYLLFDIEARLNKDLPAIQIELPIHMPYRAAQFEGSTSQAIVLFYDPPRCLKVMNPAIDRFLPVKPLYIREAAPLSRLDLIEPKPETEAVPPEHIFGSEPSHQWCYYFEKAELYAQQGEWETAAQMADQALKINKHFTEKNISELIPFIMAYAHTGRWKKAVELTAVSYQIWDKTQYPLCDAWQSIYTNSIDSEPKSASLARVEGILGCKFQGE